MEKISFGTMNWARSIGEGGREGGGQAWMRGCWTQEGGRGVETRRKDSGMQMLVGLEGRIQNPKNVISVFAWAILVLSLLADACCAPNSPPVISQPI